MQLPLGAQSVYPTPNVTAQPADALVPPGGCEMHTQSPAFLLQEPGSLEHVCGLQMNRMRQAGGEATRPDQKKAWRFLQKPAHTGRTPRAQGGTHTGQHVHGSTRHSRQRKARCQRQLAEGPRGAHTQNTLVEQPRTWGHSHPINKEAASRSPAAVSGEAGLKARSVHSDTSASSGKRGT